jgi:hypothetical protein
MIKFLEVLFRKFKADREELLTTFREATLKRIETRNHPLLAAAEEEQNNVTLIPASGNKVSVESTPKYSL